MTKYGIIGWIVFDSKPLSEQLLFGGATFDSFDEAWSFIYANDPEPEEDSPDWQVGWFDDYYVIELEKETN